MQSNPTHLPEVVHHSPTSSAAQKKRGNGTRRSSSLGSALTSKANAKPHWAPGALPAHTQWGSPADPHTVHNSHQTSIGEIGLGSQTMTASLANCPKAPWQRSFVFKEKQIATLRDWTWPMATISSVPCLRCLRAEDLRISFAKPSGAAAKALPLPSQHVIVCLRLACRAAYP